MKEHKIVKLMRFAADHTGGSLSQSNYLIANISPSSYAGLYAEVFAGWPGYTVAMQVAEARGLRVGTTHAYAQNPVQHTVVIQGSGQQPAWASDTQPGIAAWKALRKFVETGGAR